MAVNYTTEEAAGRLRLKPGTLKNWRCTGEGPRFIKVGRKVLYPEVELDAFEKGNLWLATHVRATE